MRVRVLALRELEEATISLMEPLVKLAASKIPEVVDELASRGVLKPTAKDLLDLLEVRADILTDERLTTAVREAPELLKYVLRAFIVWAAKNGFKLEYGDVLEACRKYGLERTLKFLIAYPNISARLLEFLGKLVEDYRRSRHGKAQSAPHG